MMIIVLVTTIMLLLLLLTTGTNSANCTTACGDISIPFPFGTTPKCSLGPAFHISCNQNYNPPKPFFSGSSVEILDISLVDGLIRIASSVATDCYDRSGSHLSTTISELALSHHHQHLFTLSGSRNRFTAVGCDTYALVEGSSPGWKQMSAGCVSWCDDVRAVKNGTCSGIGCCQTSIPGGVSDFLVDIRSFRNHTGVRGFNPCGYAFVAEDGAYEFRASDLMDLRGRKSVPVVLDWSAGNVSCGEAARTMSFSGFGCAGNFSECVDSGNGYRCKCLAGFEGNPYLVDGCQDINECESPEPPCEGECVNSEGSYSCSCPNGFGGDGKKDGSGCHSKARGANHNNGSNASLFYIASGLMIPAIGSSWIFWRRKQKKVVKLRQNLFIRNGGKQLEHMQRRQKTLTVFTADELEKATNNYDENNKIHGWPYYYDSVYQGTIMSADGANRKVTIHKCHKLITDDEDFISRIIILSRINHKNVLQLIGCCLETPSPLLVYELITIKTLYDYIHDNLLSWDVSLRIAADIAGALAYVHSSALPIILSSSGILLHHRYTVKLCDFALTWLDGCVIGELTGYVDPEYLLSGRLTEKSDVYSFGVVLAELLTGKDAVSHEGLLLAECFVASIRDGKLDRILDERMDTVGKIEMLKQAGKLAEKCLSDSSLDRPTMKEVAIELENIIATNPSSSRGTTASRVVRRNRSHFLTF